MSILSHPTDHATCSSSPDDAWDLHPTISDEDIEAEREYWASEQRRHAADPTEADQHVAWARGVHSAIKPFTSGTYVNYLGEEGEDRVRAAYGTKVYDRLVAVKNEYDPTNLFRANQNIKPTA